MTQQCLSVDELYRSYYKKVYGYIFLRVKNHAEAEDIAADVFAKVAEKYDTFDSSKASYSTWIFTITKNMVISHFRKYRESEDISEMEIADDSAAPLDTAILKEQSAVLAKALAAIPEKDRDIIIARYYYDKSFKEIGEMLGITEANARVSHGRVLKKLRELIGSAV